jgi:hypothetical protein
MRVVVFGGRDFDDKRWLYQVLDSVNVDRMITCIIEGEMSGAEGRAHRKASRCSDPCSSVGMELRLLPWL